MRAKTEAIAVSECRPTVGYRVVAYQILRDYFYIFFRFNFNTRNTPLVTALFTSVARRESTGLINPDYRRILTATLTSVLWAKRV